MTWPDFYLFCFLFGFFFSLASVVSGHLHLDFHGHHGHFGHIGHGGHAAHGHHHVDAGHDGRPGIAPINMGTLAAFLAWFGGAGYLAMHFYRAWFLTALGIAVTSGFAGALLVFWFLSKVLMRNKEELDPRSYDMVGVLGTVTAMVRAEGVGEITFSQQGLRRAAPVRSDDGQPIPNGVEVVVTRYQDGIAYVRRWDELTNA